MKCRLHTAAERHCLPKSDASSFYSQLYTMVRCSFYLQKCLSKCALPELQDIINEMC